MPLGWKVFNPKVVLKIALYILILESEVYRKPTNAQLDKRRHFLFDYQVFSRYNREIVR